MTDKLETKDMTVIIGLLRDSYQGLEAKNDQLEEENEKLRKALEQRNSEVRAYKKQASNYIAENIKLRGIIEGDISKMIADLIEDDIKETLRTFNTPEN